MKSVLLALLIVAIVLFVNVESRRGYHKRGYGKGRGKGDHMRRGPWHHKLRCKGELIKAQHFSKVTCFYIDTYSL